MKKVLFILPNLEAGGAERVISFVAQHISGVKFNTELLVIGDKEKSVYTTDKVKTKFLNKNRVILAIPSLIWYLLKNKPDIVLTSIGHLNTVMAFIILFFPKIKLAIREASVISSFNEFKTKNTFHDFLAKKCYPLVDGVICQSRDMADDFKKLYNISGKKLHIINNPITTISPIKAGNDTIDECRKYITIGRLSKEKGHERLLRMLAKVKVDFSYTIIGNGPERDFLLDLVNTLGLADKVNHIEYTNEVHKYLAESHIFLQGSFVEGFPNAVLESCSVGTPAIAFNVPGGTKEIIAHGVNGFLVDTEKEYLHYLQSSHLWHRQEVMDSVNRKFSEKTILTAYENFLEIL